MRFFFLPLLSPLPSLRLLLTLRGGRIWFADDSHYPSLSNSFTVLPILGFFVALSSFLTGLGPSETFYSISRSY